ncbi:MAG: hypothetical protein JXA42_01520 [Anaerolineales bacterium]|nr:hypothetical protein [Anaerolineales bacterium]
MGDFQIADMVVSSGKDYVIDQTGLAPGSLQYIDRDYTFDYIPGEVLNVTHIRTAGDDKMIDENDLCFSFRVNVPVTVYVLYADRLHLLPGWLQQYRDTRLKVTRTDSDTSTIKGIFSLFARDFDPGLVEINGNLSRAMAADPVFSSNVPLGGTYCMYSVAVQAR